MSRRAPWWTLALLPLGLALPLGATHAVVVAAVAVRLWVPLLRWARARMAASSPVQLPGDVHLGREHGGGDVVLDDAQLSAHGLVLGASGAGKSTTLLRILCARVAEGRPVVAIDLKGSPGFAASLQEAADAAGRRLRVWTPDGEERWNPLRHGNATELKDKLIATERFSEPHYQRAAERYLQLAFQVLLDTGRRPSLEQVVEVLEPIRLVGLAEELPAERRDRLADYLAALGRDGHSAVRGLASRLALLTESHTGRFLNDPDGPGIDVRRALRGEEVVLFSLNSSVYGQLSAQIGTLVLQDLVAAAGHRLREPGPQAIVAVDEFSALRGDNVMALLARGRESGVAVLLATQELADLERAGRGLRDQVLGNTAVKVVHRQDVPASAGLVAQMAGTRKVWERAYTSAGGGGPWGRERVTRREAEQFLVHPNQIKTLRAGEAVLISKVPRTRVRMVSVDPARGAER